MMKKERKKHQSSPAFLSHVTSTQIAAAKHARRKHFNPPVYVELSRSDGLQVRQMQPLTCDAKEAPQRRNSR